MIDHKRFSEWLVQNTSYSDAVISDTLSRIKRADGILPYTGEETYLFYLEQREGFRGLSVSVRSQIRKAVRLYMEFQNRAAV